MAFDTILKVRTGGSGLKQGKGQIRRQPDLLLPVIFDITARLLQPCDRAKLFFSSP